jgi:hypothetical protein
MDHTYFRAKITLQLQGELYVILPRMSTESPMKYAAEFTEVAIAGAFGTFDLGVCHVDL